MLETLGAVLKLGGALGEALEGSENEVEKNGSSSHTGLDIRGHYKVIYLEMDDADKDGEGLRSTDRTRLKALRSSFMLEHLTVADVQLRYYFSFVSPSWSRLD